MLTPIADAIRETEPRPARVLHVDDEPDFVEMTAIFLERIQDQFTVISETSAEAGLNRLEDEQIDCVISDYQMPRMDGIEFLQAVREDHPDLPFILCTARGSEEVASEAIAAGVTDYIQKGSDTDHYEVLANRVLNAIEQYQTREQLWDTLSWSHTLMEQDLIGVYIIKGGKFIYVNDRFAAMFGYAQEDVIGASATRLAVAENGDETTQTGFDRRPDDDEPMRFRLAGRTKEGRLREVEVHLAPVKFQADTATLGLVREIGDAQAEGVDGR